MNVSVAYTEENRQAWLPISIDDNASIEDVIQASGITQRFPHIDLKTQRVGIFGKLAKLDTTVNEGDRIEIYRKVTRVLDEDDDDDDE
jgi:putative ubiquitin-RnfH superfamily antitoxin RatB of RatAB toxin-antitoxin module